MTLPSYSGFRSNSLPFGYMTNDKNILTQPVLNIPQEYLSMKLRWTR